MIVFHELDQIVAIHVRTIFTGIRLTALRGVDIGILVTFGTRWIAFFITSPHAPVIKTVLLQCVWLESEIVNLPFPSNDTGVAEFL